MKEPKIKITPNRKYYKKSLNLKEYIEDNYTNAITPMKLTLIAKHFGLSIYYIVKFIDYHKLNRNKEISMNKAIELLKEGILNEWQIRDITKIGYETIRDLKKGVEKEDEKDVGK